jgi:hypothetical protein
VGDRLTGKDDPQQTVAKSYGDIFDEFLPEYLAIGMTYDEYWDGEFGTKRAARKAYAIRVKNEQMLADRQNWYMGQYLLAALRSIPLLVAGLNVKSSTKLPDYPSKPFMETIEDQKKEEVRKQKEEDQIKLSMAMMQAAFSRFNKRFEQNTEKTKAVVTGG